MHTGSSSSPRRRPAQAGATIVEVLISLVLVVIGLLGVYSAYTASVQASSHGMRLTQATAKAERQLEILRHAPAAAIKCLASGGAVDTCVAACCTGMGDGGVTCTPGQDGGSTPSLCLLVPPDENDPPGSPITYTYDPPIITVPEIGLPLYEVQVTVKYRMLGEAMGGASVDADVRSVRLKSSLYKPE